MNINNLENLPKKILVIGQAPPAKKQELPYDSTMMYDWLKECGITKEKAQEIFDWDAVYDKFPGFLNKAHKAPNQEQMDEYWERSLKSKVLNADKVWILGRVAEKYLSDKDEIMTKDTLISMHPSIFNLSIYRANKERIISEIKNFVL